MIIKRDFILFLIVLLLFIGLFIYSNININEGDISSDVWLYQYSVIRGIEKEISPDSYFPENYTNEKYYLAYPIMYYLNPGFMAGMINYFILALFILILIYLINGLIVKKVFNSWILAIAAGALSLIPRYVFLTHIGMLNFRNFRGLSFAFPFYFLLSHYWLIYGIKSRTKNVLLAILASSLVYLYPPVGVFIIPIYILTALFIYKKKYLKEVVIFSLIYIILSSLFFVGHFSNPSSGMLDNEDILTEEQLALQAEIFDYRVPGGTLRIIDFGTLKRSVWDGLPLLLVFISSIYLVRKYKNKLSNEQNTFSKINFSFSVILIMFVVLIEIINLVLYKNNLPPFFAEHLRLLRALGFLWIAQSILVLYIIFYKLNRKKFAVALFIVLSLSPLYFSAPLIRYTVRLVVPESIRIKFNLAPIVEGEPINYNNLSEIALWTRDNLPLNITKIFVFNDFQNEFRFKVLSRHDTNMTIKEGSVWVTSGFVNSQKWYNERMEYKKIVEPADNFMSIVDFARQIGSTHMLIPKGQYETLFLKEENNFDTLYQNTDYRLIKLNR